jgi:hypothetical protein
MVSRAKLQEKLANLNSKLSETTESQTAEELLKHLDMLRDVMNVMGSMEKDLKKAVDESNPDACILRVTTSFPRAADGGVLYPPRKYIQEKLNRVFRQNIRYEIEVQATFVEMNYNNILHYPADNYLRQEEEFYVKVGSPEQMESILKLSDCIHFVGFEFIKPTENFATREAYRTIGHLLLRLKIVDQKCKKLGAIPGRRGVPILPEDFVQTDEFKKTVEKYQWDNIAENLSRAAGKIFKDGTPIEDVHAYLCSHTPVDKRKRQKELDTLVGERIDILKKLLSFNQDDFPFTFDREFK